ncbi:MAG: FAD-dependent oxidoreductase [Verrucomicrobiota bacterium]|jgi:NADPH-dependent 2,4-dienoyl-CoA reductase/sulfur reductase-like enzyme|nr:FAD-dependent oxidoreductase [Verrucomicrobiota bacterium]MDP7048040.1 FAD-dependent oxidoreductase [Verrucomicrobiota bacterium]
MSNAQHFKVAIIGGGPAGIGVAVGLAKRGVGPVVLIERRTEIGGTPMGYRKKPGGVPTFVEWTRGRVVFGEELAGRLAKRLALTDTAIRLSTQVTKIDPAEKRLTLLGQEGVCDITADAVVLTAGAREQTPAEKGWLAGARTSRVGFTRHLTGWLDGHGLLPARKPVVVGSDLIAYSAAAKMRDAGSDEPVMIDQRRGPSAGLFERFFFRRWTRPDWPGGVTAVEIKGDRYFVGIKSNDGKEWPGDGVIICGELVPNTELALLGGLAVELPSRQLQLARGQALSQPGWFAAGNVLGGFHGAQWCYFNGRRVARTVSHFL